MSLIRPTCSTGGKKTYRISSIGPNLICNRRLSPSYGTNRVRSFRRPSSLIRFFFGHVRTASAGSTGNGKTLPARSLTSASDHRWKNPNQNLDTNTPPSSTRRALLVYSSCVRDTVSSVPSALVQLHFAPTFR
jgi:hypothetical protein